MQPIGTPSSILWTTPTKGSLGEELQNLSDLTELNQCLASENVDAIVHDSRLFLQLFSERFCGIIANYNYDIDVIKMAVEKLRLEFAKAFEENRNIHLKFFSDAHGILYISEVGGKLYANEEEKFGFASNMSWFLFLHLPAFAKALGMSGKVTDRYRSNVLPLLQVGKKDQALRTICVQIDLKWEISFPFQIPPLDLPLVSIQDAFYEMFKKGEYCDVTLKCTENKEIKAHKIMVMGFSGDVFKAMESFKEGQESVISLTTWKLTTVSAYLDFIYGGYNLFLKKTVNQVHQKGDLPFDSCELLSFAHTYQNEGLFIAAVNLLCLFATPSQKEEILIEANRYDNHKLHELYRHLAQNQDKMIITP